jgi:S-adenosylmethionine hydrolase
MTLVTLTTDFGLADGYVGAMKGMILSLAPNAQVVDIAHDIGRHDIAAGAFTLASAAPNFPAKTIHVAVIDPGVGSERAPVVVDNGREWFVGPDNGLLSLVASSPRSVYRISAPGFVREGASPTFHGRDIFAVAAGRLAAGATPAEVGPVCELTGCLTLPQASDNKTADGLYGTVIHIDGFGNLITDLDPDQLPANPQFLVAGRVIGDLSATFSSVERGRLLAYVGSGNTLEIAVREGDAAVNLDVERGAIIKVLAGATE